MSEKRMKRARITAANATAPHLASEQVQRLVALAALSDDAIDVPDPDAPEIADWSGAVRGKFYKPVKTLKSLRLDADVLAWFQAQGPGYQTRINRVLREAMLHDVRHAAAKRAGKSGG